MSIAPETIEQIRSAVDIAELIREYIPTLKRSGRNWKANCPFHHEKTPSFMVNPEKAIFHCFGCHTGGDVFKFVMLIDSLSWPEAVKKLAARAGITIKETRDEQIRRSEKQKIYDLLAQAAKFYHRNLIESDEAETARRYLKKRGVSESSIENFQIGFAPAGKLVPQAARKDFTVEQLIAAGIVTKTERGKIYEYMSGRIVFPILDTQGRVVAFGGRSLKDEQPKYLNTPETAVYSKSQQLYGLFQSLPTLRQNREILVLEGYMDVVVTHQFGVTNAVATLGTSFTQHHATMMARYAESVILLFDPDPAGVNAAKRALETLLGMDCALSVASLPDGVDSDEYLIKEGKEPFLRILKEQSKSAMDFVIGQALQTHGTASPEEKAKAVQEVLPYIGKIRNAVIRQEWIRTLAQKLKTTEDAVSKEMRRTVRPGQDVSAPVTTGKSGAIRSAEEEILQLVIAFPQCRGAVNESLFKDERNRRLFALLARDIPVSDIANHLEETESGWFTELALEEKNYAQPEMALATIIREIRNQELEAQRQKLEKDVVLMLEGKIPRNDETLQLYQELNKQLKGSVRE